MDDEPASVSDRLALLESNYNVLSDRICQVRLDDFKRAVIGDIAEVLSEEGKKLAHRGVVGMGGFAICHNLEACRHGLGEVMDQATDAFYRIGPENALSILNEFREHVMQNSGCESKGCQEYLATVLNEAIVSLNIARRLQERMESIGAIAPNPKPVDLSRDIVSTLSALANPYRLQILESLYESGKSFSDLSQFTGLRTGHLQFHIQSLLEQDTIRKTSIRGLYAITIQGMTVLEGLREFDARMGSLSKTKEVPI